MRYVKNSFQSKWITDKIEDKTIEWAKEFGFFLAKDDGRQKGKLSTTQLRKFFGQLKRVQAEVLVEGKYEQQHRIKMLMLAPQLAYAVGRDKKGNKQTKINYFQEEVTTMLKSVTEIGYFNNFVNIIEAIVAYHKFEGGE
jgi:CRISPR type III-A-associated protein Csm2